MNMCKLVVNFVCLFVTGFSYTSLMLTVTHYNNDHACDNNMLIIVKRAEIVAKTRFVKFAFQCWPWHNK